VSLGVLRPVDQFERKRKKMNTEVAALKMPDEFYAGEPYSFSYRFVDKNKNPIPNEFGYRVMKYLKPSCIQNSRAVVAHSDVNPVLIEFDRDELAQILRQNDDPWIPVVLKKSKNSSHGHHDDETEE
jgi:hypothetical protein